MAAEELFHQGGTFGAVVLFGTPSRAGVLLQGWGCPGELPPPSEGLSTSQCRHKKIQPPNSLSASYMSGWFITKISANQIFPLHLLCPEQWAAVAAAVLSLSCPQSFCWFGLAGAVQHWGCVSGFPMIWGSSCSSGTAPGSRTGEGWDAMSVHVLPRSLPYPQVKT